MAKKRTSRETPRRDVMNREIDDYMSKRRKIDEHGAFYKKFLASFRKRSSRIKEKVNDYVVVETVSQEEEDDEGYHDVTEPLPAQKSSTKGGFLSRITGFFSRSRSQDESEEYEDADEAVSENSEDSTTHDSDEVKDAHHIKKAHKKIFDRIKKKHFSAHKDEELQVDLKVKEDERIVEDHEVDELDDESEEEVEEEYTPRHQDDHVEEEDEHEEDEHDEHLDHSLRNDERYGTSASDDDSDAQDHDDGHDDAYETYEASDDDFEEMSSAYSGSGDYDSRRSTLLQSVKGWMKRGSKHEEPKDTSYSLEDAHDEFEDDDTNHSETVMSVEDEADEIFGDAPQKRASPKRKAPVRKPAVKKKAPVRKHAPKKKVTKKAAPKKKAPARKPAVKKKAPAKKAPAKKKAASSKSKKKK